MRDVRELLWVDPQRPPAPAGRPAGDTVYLRELRLEIARRRKNGTLIEPDDEEMDPPPITPVARQRRRYYMWKVKQALKAGGRGQ